MQNIVINMCKKFRYDRLRNDRALGNGKSDNNPKNKNNNKKKPLGTHFQVRKLKKMFINVYYNYGYLSLARQLLRIAGVGPYTLLEALLGIASCEIVALNSVLLYSGV